MKLESLQEESPLVIRNVCAATSKSDLISVSSFDNCPEYSAEYSQNDNDIVVESSMAMHVDQ